MKERNTRSQDRILKQLAKLDCEISAQDLYVRLRRQNQSIGLATVYRSLEALKVKGLVQARILSNGESVYSSLQQDNHHLTCLQCGRSQILAECPVSHVGRSLEKSYNFKVFYHTLEFFGLCDRCTAMQESD